MGPVKSDGWREVFCWVPLSDIDTLLYKSSGRYGVAAPNRTVSHPPTPPLLGQGLLGLPLQLLVQELQGAVGRSSRMSFWTKSSKNPRTRWTSR